MVCRKKRGDELYCVQAADGLREDEGKRAELCIADSLIEAEGEGNCEVLPMALLKGSFEIFD